MRPPRLLERFLSGLLPRHLRESVLGDLREEYQERREGETGWAAAALWYATQVVAIPARLLASGAGERHGLGREARQALRQLRKRPGFAAVVVITLGVGVGVNAVILSLADVVLFDPLPYPAHERLVILTNDFSGSPTGSFGVSYPNIRDARERTPVLDEVALFMDWQNVYLSGAGRDPRRLRANFSTADYFSLLGAEAALGRLFTETEDRRGGPEPVVVLSWGAWQRLFGADPEVLGRRILLNDRPFEVIGVLSPGFVDLGTRGDGLPVDVFLPFMAAPALASGVDLDDRGQRFMNPLVRIPRGTTDEAVRRELAAVSAELAREFPETNEGWTLHAESLETAFFGDLRTPVFVLMAGALLVFLLVCVNLTNLVLVRATGRVREMALRRTLGAQPGRLVRLLLIESLVLAGLGGLLALAVAPWGLTWLRGVELVELPAFASATLDVRVLLASAGLTVAAGVVLGLVPAWSLLRVGPARGLRSARGASVGRRERRVQGLLVASEVGLAFVVLVGAGLLLQSFRTLRSTGYGFDDSKLLTAQVELRGERYAGEEVRRNTLWSLEERAADLPGVEHAFLWGPNRLGHGNWVDILTREDRWHDYPDERLEASRHQMRPGTLRKLGIPLLAGRDFGAGDDAESPRVAIISESLARALFGEVDVVGRRIESGRWGGTVFQVVGVVADARHRTRLFQPFGAQWDVYFPFRQETHRLATLVIRAGEDRDAADLAAPLRTVVREVDPTLAVYGVGTMAEQMREEESRSRLTALLVGLYAGLAALLAALGVYGVLAHTVRQRLREMGIRIALGARGADVVKKVVGMGLGVVAWGLAGGLVVALVSTGLLASALYGVSPREPEIFALVGAALLAVALAASLLPGWRATRVDPITVMKEE